MASLRSQRSQKHKSAICSLLPFPPGEGRGEGGQAGRTRQTSARIPPSYPAPRPLEPRPAPPSVPAMRYISTRGQAPVRDFAGVLLAGLAEDGGLYVPDAWPHLSPADLRALRGLPYHELAARVMHPFVGGSIPSDVLAGMCRDAYAGFRHPAVVPLVQLDTDLWTQELFHGPTLAFKDLAMQLLGRMFRLGPETVKASASPSSAPPPATQGPPPLRHAATAPPWM